MLCIIEYAGKVQKTMPRTVSNLKKKEGLSDRTLENIRNFHLFNPTPEEFRTLFEQAGFSDIQVHLKDGEDWICVEGHKM